MNLLVGFINGTCCSSVKILHESMFSHDVNGHTLVIHSVVIAPSYRKKGLGSVMLQKYIEEVCQVDTNVERILLLSKAELLTFYVRNGFTVLGLSEVQHGQV